MKEKIKSLEETLVSLKSKEELENLKGYLKGLGLSAPDLDWKGDKNSHLKVDFRYSPYCEWTEKKTERDYVESLYNFIYMTVVALED